MIEVKNIGKTNGYVYDISLDGTVVNALGMNILSNTDGFNFQMPKTFRYTEEHPYVSSGKGRNTVKGKKYTNVEADVAEFEDNFLFRAFNGGVNKQGLGIDEYVSSSINFSRKNYADLLDDQKIKLVGNSIKSKKMPLYIEKFMNKGIDMLLHNKGKEFLESYYDYIEKIYNLQIPLKDIASVGKIKTSIKEYKKNCEQYTKAGNKKARQACYELAIKNNVNVNMGDAIYYINIGKRKADTDIQKVTKYYNNGVDVTKEYSREYSRYEKEFKVKGEEGKKIKKADFIRKSHPGVVEEDEVIFNCIMLPNDIVEDENDNYCTSDFEYNVAKYIDQFNNRIKPLLVCFSKDIRVRIDKNGKEENNILIDNPANRKAFTEKECRLTVGEPFDERDQDTYQQLMSMEDKEIKFWLSAGKVPPYIKECGIDWDTVVEDYNKRQEDLKREEIQLEISCYNTAIDNLSQADIDNFCENGVVPKKISDICDIKVKEHLFVSKKWNVTLGTFFDILDKNI